MPSPMVNMIGNPEISPLVLCTPIHEFEFVPLEELENETPKVNPKVSSQQKLISKGVKNDSKNFPLVNQKQKIAHQPSIEFEVGKQETGWKLRSVLGLSADVRSNHVAKNLTFSKLITPLSDFDVTRFSANTEESFNDERQA